MISYAPLQRTWISPQSEESLVEIPTQKQMTTIAEKRKQVHTETQAQNVDSSNFESKATGNTNEMRQQEEEEEASDDHHNASDGFNVETGQRNVDNENGDEDPEAADTHPDDNTSEEDLKIDPDAIVASLSQDCDELCIRKIETIIASRLDGHKYKRSTQSHSSPPSLRPWP